MELKGLSCPLPQSQKGFLFYYFSYSEIEVACFALTTMDHHGPPWTTMDMYTSNKKGIYAQMQHW